MQAIPLCFGIVSKGTYLPRPIIMHILANVKRNRLIRTDITLNIVAICLLSRTHAISYSRVKVGQTPATCSRYLRIHFYLGAQPQDGEDYNCADDRRCDYPFR